MDIYVALAYFHTLEGPMFITCIPHAILNDAKEFYIANKALANTGFSLFEEENMLVLSYGFHIHSVQSNSYHRFSLIILLLNFKELPDGILVKIKHQMKTLCKILEKPILEQNLEVINKKLLEFRQEILQLLQKKFIKENITSLYKHCKKYVLAIYDSRTKAFMILGNTKDFKEKLAIGALCALPSKNYRFFVLTEKENLKAARRIIVRLNELENQSLLPTYDTIVCETDDRKGDYTTQIPSPNEDKYKTGYACAWYRRMLPKKEEKQEPISWSNNAR